MIFLTAFLKIKYKTKSKDAYSFSFSTLHFYHYKYNQNFLVQSLLFFAFFPTLVFLEVNFVIEKLSKELEETDSNFVNRLLTIE